MMNRLVTFNQVKFGVQCYDFGNSLAQKSCRFLLKIQLLVQTNGFSKQKLVRVVENSDNYVDPLF
jgi:hypothetical protein